MPINKRKWHLNFKSRLILLGKILKISDTAIILCRAYLCLKLLPNIIPKNINLKYRFSYRTFP